MAEEKEQESVETPETTQSQEQTQEQVETQSKPEEEKKEEKKEAPKRLGSGKKGRSFQEILKETREQAKGKEAKPEEKKPDEAKADKSDAHKKPANERIQDLITQNKEAEEKNKGFQTQLSDEQKKSSGLEERLKSLENKLDQKVVEKAKETVKKEEPIDYDKVREELEDEGRTEKQINIYIKALKRGDDAEKRIHLLEEKLNQRDKDDTEKRKDEDTKAQKDFVKKQEGIYLEIAKLPEYKDYFNVPEDGKMPDLKDPEMDKVATELSSLFNVPVYLEGEKEPVNVNPVLATKEGLQMFMFWITRKGRANTKAKEKVEKEQSLKNKVVTQPSVNKSSRAKGKRSFAEILEETRQEMNM